MTKNIQYIYFSIIIGILFIFFIREYLTLIAIACITVIVYNPLYKWFVNHTGGNINLSVTLILLSIFLSFVIPVTIILALSYSQAQVFVSDFQQAFSSSKVQEGNPLQDTEFIDSIIVVTNDLIDNLNIIDYDLNVEDIRQQLSNSLGSVSSFLFNRIANASNSALNFVTIIFIYGTLLAEIFPNQRKILEIINKTSPFSNHINDVFIRKIVVMANAMVTGTLIIGTIQAICSGITLWIVGVPYLFFVVMIILFMSIIPVFGGGIIMIPISLILVITGNIWQGVVVFLVQAIFISNIDNVLRPMLVPEEARLPASHILIGVFAGLTTFGVIGVILGPIIMIISQTTLETYNKYFSFNLDFDVKKSHRTTKITNDTRTIVIKKKPTVQKINKI